jgi:hypothetical protein
MAAPTIADMALAEQLALQGMDWQRVKAALNAQRVETPEWGYGNCRTRFKTFLWPLVQFGQSCGSSPRPLFGRRQWSVGRAEAVWRPS